MLLSLAASLALAPGLMAAPLAPPFDFYRFGPYDRSVPRPEQILGYGPGDQHTTFRDQERTLDAIIRAVPDRIKSIGYGKSVQGRPLRVLAISNPRNLRRLDAIQREHAELAQGKGDPAKTLPIIWINQCIHGDETASFESAMWLVYTLAAQRGGSIDRALEKCVVMVNPVYNPDGHERYVVYYNSVAVGASDPGAYELNAPQVMLGRPNHYRFDMNRDRIAFSQQETRAEFAEFLKWGPQVYVDQHGQVSTYFFPPEPMSINPNVDRARNKKWKEYLGRANGKAFDDLGFTYYVRDIFDFYAPAYLDISTTLSGAIGMTYETDGGRYLARERVDGTVLTLRTGMAKHLVSALSTIEAAAARGSDLLADYAKFKRDAVTGTHAGKFQRVVLTGDRRALTRLKEQLAFAGIVARFAAKPFEQPDAHDYWSGATGKQAFPAGALVVDLAQSQGQFAKTLLEPGNGFEPEFVKAQLEKRKAAPEGETYPGPENPEFYDLTGWALPYAHNLPAWWCESAPTIETREAVPGPGAIRGESSVGYAIPYTDESDILAAADALLAGMRGLFTTRPMRLAGQEYAAGTFLFLTERNEGDLGPRLRRLAEKRGATVLPLPTAFPDAERHGPGSESTFALRAPKIAVAMGSVGQFGGGGAFWYLMERVFRLPFTPLANSALGGNLSRFNCLVVPGGANSAVGGKVREWVSDGNVLVALEAGGAMLGSNGFVDLDRVSGDPAYLPGAIFRANLDARSFLSYGYGPAKNGKIEISFPVAGGSFYKARKAGGSVVTLPGEENVTKLLTGWAWPDDTEKALRNTVWVQDAPLGNGRAVLFLGDPTERAMWNGLFKMLLNAMLLGNGRSTA